MNKIMIVAALILIIFLQISPILAEENLNTDYPDHSVDAECEKECLPHQTMKNLVEGRVAQVSCLQTCKQRKVWEKLAVSIAAVADSLKNNSYDQLKSKLEVIEKKLDEQKD